MHVISSTLLPVLTMNITYAVELCSTTYSAANGKNRQCAVLVVQRIPSDLAIAPHVRHNSQRRKVSSLIFVIFVSLQTKTRTVLASFEQLYIIPCARWLEKYMNEVNSGTMTTNLDLSIHQILDDTTQHAVLLDLVNSRRLRPRFCSAVITTLQHASIEFRFQGFDLPSNF